MDAMSSSSLPTRGAWIEIASTKSSARNSTSRSPRGERGLKYDGRILQPCRWRRSPRGERGLKYGKNFYNMGGLYVAPHAGSVD